MSEAELHLIRARLDGGLRNKAARGELRLALPVGLDRDEDGRIVLCPDEQVRHAIERVFVLWRRLGSARQVVIELIAEGQQLPRRTVGQRRVRWARASYGAVHDFLTNPAYAGAFVFGRTRREKRLDAARAGAGARRRGAAGGVVCLPARAPSRLCVLARVPADARAAARERETARRGRRRRPRGRRAAAGPRCAAGAAGGACRSPIPAPTARVRRYACVRGHVLHAHRPDLPVARRRPPRQGRRRRVPGGRHPGRRRRDRRRGRASSRTSTTSGSPASGSRSSAPSSRPTARAASSTPASPSTASSRAPSKRALEDALAARRARARQARRARAGPPGAADRRRARRARAARARSAAAVERRRRRPTATARNCCAR